MSRSVFWARDAMARTPIAKKYNTALRMVHSRAEKALCGWRFMASRYLWLMKLKCINHKGYGGAQTNDAQNSSKLSRRNQTRRGEVIGGSPDTLVRVGKLGVAGTNGFSRKSTLVDDRREVCKVEDCTIAG